MAFALKYFFTHHRIEKVQDLEKAEHKKEEHERKEMRVAPKRRRGCARRAPQPGKGPRWTPRRRAPRGAPPPARSAPPETERAVREPGHPPSVEVEVGRQPARARGAGGEPRPAAIYLTLGEQDGADEAKVREAVRQLVPGLELLGVEVRRSHTYLDVKPDAIEVAVSALHGKEVGGKTLTAERARRRRR